jgi:5-(carboxyamino)imidazole ribonucleotide synthase
MLKSGATIGIVGGGQLGRMLAMAAAHMGFRVHIYTPEADGPASQVTNHVTVAPYTDEVALKAFAAACDVITFEFENVPHESLALLQQHCAVYPDPKVLEACRHRLREKEMINAAGIATAPFAAVDSLAALEASIAELGTPAVLKSCELGYDGKGQFKIDAPEQAAEAWESLATQEAVLEGWLAYQCEASVIVARGQDGQMRCYEPSQNLHENHILARTQVPANLPEPTVGEARRIAMKLAETLGLVGIMAVELFVMPDGALIVNELAPRPHNSGHWTMEAAATSQFEQQIRAVSSIALGDTTTLCPAEMLNLIGDDVSNLSTHQSNPAAHVHLYGKAEVRAGRKMGHITTLKPSSPESR